MTTTAASPPASDASTFHAVQRRLAAMLPDAATLAGGGTLELSGMFAQERPRLDAPELLEGSSLRSLRVPGDPVARFAAFLDGTQSSRVTQYVGGVPLVHGTVAAVIRERRDRRLTTWRTALVQRRVYAPLALVPPHVRDALAESGAEVFDTTATRELDSVHPFALQEAALQAVQRDRSRLEKELAEAWCAEEREALRAERSEALYIDGGISESAQVATSDVVVGVVKTHRQLYVHGDDLPTILGLGVGERSSVTRVAPRSRTPVASWYLRLREAKGHDPLWGLVRVEIAEPRGAPSTSVGDRANDVSRWVLAEALPLALPDGRWDKMVYGIRDCEEFLRAIQ